MPTPAAAPSRPRWAMPAGLHQLDRIEWLQHEILRRQKRIGWDLTKHILNSSTSSPTAPTSPIAMDTSTSLSDSSAASSPPPLVKHARKFLPRVLGWLAERLFQFLGPSLLALALAAWAMIRKWGEVIAQWVAGCWHWVVG